MRKREAQIAAINGLSSRSRCQVEVAPRARLLKSTVSLPSPEFSVITSLPKLLPLKTYVLLPPPAKVSSPAPPSRVLGSSGQIVASGFDNVLSTEHVG